MKTLDYFLEGGPLSAVLPGFGPRPQQTQMALAVEEGLASGGKVIVEAGTGVGKSLAYLLPSALWAVQNKKRVVVATHTKALQEQLIGKDLPAVQRVLKAAGLDLQYSILMGSENYLCMQRLHRAAEGQADLLATGEQQKTLQALVRWSQTAETGLRSRIPMDLPHEVWDSVNRDPDLCLGKKGPYRETCLYRKDVERARASHILVVNQHLLLSGLPGWLDYDAVVIDEAHNVEDVAVSCFGITLTEGRILRLLNDTFNAKTARGAVARMKVLPPELREAIRKGVKEAHAASAAFFEGVRDALRLVPAFDVAQGGAAKRVLEPALVEDGLTYLLENLELELQTCLRHCSTKEEELQISALCRRYLQVVLEVRRFLKCEDKDFAYWGELRSVRRKAATFVHVKPVDVSKPLRDMFFDKNLPVILTSATLSAGKGFEHFKERIGALGTVEHQVDSPFDYPSNARLMVPSGFPDPSEKSDDYDRWVVEYCTRLVDHVPGGIFFLFTSWKTLRTVAAQVRARGVQRPIFIQGEEFPAKLLEDFKAAKNGLLLGTDTFWQGVDVPGPALSCVVITKLPFMPPDSPLEQARQEWYVRQGKSPFEHYVLPRAVIKFRQGFGRLIRTQEDIGAVIVLDPRVKTKRYGKVFLDSIPKCPELAKLKDLSAFFAAKSASLSRDRKRLDDA